MTEWVRVAAMNDFGDEDVIGVKANNVFIALYRLGDSIYATHDVCTHGRARLSRGYLENGLIECPVHQGLFDVKTGAVAGPPCTEPLRTYRVNVEAGEIWVEV